MTAHKTRRTPARRKASRAATDMAMLAPMVIAMRVPSLWWEMTTPHFAPKRKGEEGHRAVIEKAAAVMEGYGAAHAEMMQAWASLWIETVSGDLPDARRIARKVQDIADASIEPAAKRVRANYRRLKARR